jgi:hypothetical protein
MRRSFRIIAVLSIIAALGPAVAAQAATVGFEDISVPTDSSIAPATGGELTNAAAGYSSGGNPVSPPYTSGPDGYDDSGTLYTSSFSDGGVQFANSNIPQDYTYSGWAISSVNGVTVPTSAEYQAAGEDDYATPYEYSAYTVGTQELAGGGAAGSTNYGVMYDDGTPADGAVTLPAGTTPVSIDITNTTYAALAILYGDGFATAFTPGNGWFLLTINGTKADGSSAGSVEFYLADYRSPNSANDYLVNQWTDVNLSSLAGAQTLTFSLTSSDVGFFGSNTPSLFAADNLVLTPEPSSLALSLIAGLCTAAVAARRRMRSKSG